MHRVEHHRVPLPTVLRYSIQFRIRVLLWLLIILCMARRLVVRPVLHYQASTRFSLDQTVVGHNCSILYITVRTLVP